MIYLSVTHNSPEVHLAALSHAYTLYAALRGEIASVDGHHISIADWRAYTRERFIWDARDSWSIAQSCLHYDKSFSETVDNCIAVGGDTDTYAAIAGPIAEALWGIDDRSYESFIESDKIRAAYESMRVK